MNAKISTTTIIFSLLCIQVLGNRVRLNYLERKIVAMETSFFQDIQMLRQDVTYERNEKDKAIALLNETLQFLQEKILKEQADIPEATAVTMVTKPLDRDNKIQEAKETFGVQILTKAFQDLKSKSYATVSGLNTSLSDLNEKLLNASSVSKLQDKILRDNVSLIADLCLRNEEEIHKLNRNISSLLDFSSNNDMEIDLLKTELSEVKLLQNNVSILENLSVAKHGGEINALKAKQSQTEIVQDNMFAMVAGMLSENEDDIKKLKAILQTTRVDPLLSKLCWNSFKAPYIKDGYLYPGTVSACQSVNCCIRRILESSEIKKPNTLTFTYPSTDLSEVVPDLEHIRLAYISSTDNAGYLGNVEFYVKKYNNWFVDIYEQWISLNAFPLDSYWSEARLANFTCKQLGLSLVYRRSNFDDFESGNFVEIFDCSTDVNRLQNCQRWELTDFGWTLTVECNPESS